MTNLTDLEKTKLANASNLAGEYIDSIGKTDLAVFTKEEWKTLIEVIFNAFSIPF